MEHQRFSFSLFLCQLASDVYNDIYIYIYICARNKCARYAVQKLVSSVKFVHKLR